MEKEKIVFKGSHPDSLYRVPTSSGAGAGKLARVLRVLRWPAALLVVCAALAVFVYFLMPDNMTSDLDIANSTYWETTAAGVGAPLHRTPETPGQKATDIKKTSSRKNSQKQGSKTPEIDFYGADADKTIELIPLIEITNEEKKPKKKLPIAPVFPVHIAPEVQYGNEKADTDKLRSGKKIEDLNKVTTVKPHITQKPEKPLAIYFKDAVTAPAHTETITRAETVNDFLFEEKQTTNAVKEETGRYLTTKTQEDKVREKIYSAQPELPPEVQEYYNRPSVNFTSGHSKLFGIGIEDAEKMHSTTQSSLYNTRVSPTLPTWRDGDDSTTKKYPVNANYDVPQCRSPRLAFCRGVLPYDLAGPSATIGGADITSLLPQFEYMMATNCSERVRHFACALLEPECNPPPYPAKMPCHSLCKAVRDNCGNFIPRKLLPAFNCKQYSSNNCVVARSPCYEREIPCGDGTCIPRDWMCDGTRDCPNGEDEEPCVTCTKDEFRCPNGGCILNRWVCDGYKDCPKGEDEDAGRCGGSGVWLREHAEPLRGEPGEEPAGSAPLPSIRKPNRLPDGRTGAAESDSSKELLMTSDSSNALKRNFTRRPSPSRLTPYRPKVRTTTTAVYDSEETVEPQMPIIMKKFQSRVTTTTLKPVATQQTNHESAEDVNIGDLGFFEDVEESKSFKPAGRKAGGEPPRQAAPSRPMMPAEPTHQDPTHVDKSMSKFDRVIDGASMMRKAAAAEAAEEAAMNYTAPPEKDDFPTDRGSGGISSHSSPCPSGELRCVDGRCITLAQLCDGTIDCSDHADEDNCYT